MVSAGCRRNHLRIKRSVAYLLVGRFEVPDNGSEVPILGCQHRLWIARGNAIPLEFVKVFVCEERRLANPFRIQEAESALKRGGRRSRFLEQVGICPVAHSLHFSFAGLELAQDVRRTDVGIMHRVARRVARAPLGEIQRKSRKRRSRDLLANVANVSDDCIRRCGEFRIALPFFVEKTTVNTVRMSCYEINSRHHSA